MLSIKPLAATALSLLFTASVIAQPATAIVKNTTQKKVERFNGVLSFNTGVFGFPRRYSTVNINLPYTVKPQGSIAQNLTYKARVANYFTKPAVTVELVHLELERVKHGIYFGIGFSPNYEHTTSDNNDNKTFFLSAGYQWIIPLTKKPGNSFVLKPGLGFGIYQFDVDYDSTIDNKKKTIEIAGQTYNPSFVRAKRHYKTTIDADYLELFYQNTNFMVIPQVTLAHQNKDHTFYYSATVGWAQRFAGDGGHTIILQHGIGKDYVNNRVIVPVTNPYHFYGPIAKVGIGFYFDKDRQERKKLQKLQRQRMKEMINV